MAQCDKCGSPLSDAQKFCGTCGNVVAEQAAASAAVTPPPVPTPPPTLTPPAYPPQGAPQGYPPQGYQQPAYGPGGGYPNAAWQAPKKSKKGMWIGIAASVLVLAVAAILVFVVFWDQVSGKGDGGGGGSDASAQQMLAASWAASENAADASGSYEVSITLDTDTSQSQGSMAGLLAGPITVSGTFATTQSPTAVDMTLSTSLLGQPLDAGVRLVDGTPYILFSGQWYDAPPELMQGTTDTSTTPDVAALKTLLANLAIDPSTWLKGLKEVGTEDIDGVKSVHLTGSPDVVKMITDITALMNSPEGQSLLNAAGSATGSTDTSMPTAQELADMQTQLDAMLKVATVDLWLSKDDNSIRKFALNLQIDPTAIDQSTDSSDLSSGLSELKGIGLTASVTLASGKPAPIVAPESPLPSTELQNALSSNPLFGMLLGGAGL